MNSERTTTCGLHAALVALALAPLSGCANSDAKQIVFGTVTAGGQAVETGEVRLVPREGTVGPVHSAPIAQGAYRLEARGGVPSGAYRVEVVAQRKTGRKLTQTFNAEKIEVDETKPIGPPEYGGEASPLVATVPLESGGQFDIELPLGRP